MARTYAKAKGRRESGPFVPLPCNVISHPNFLKLSGNALRMFIYLCNQLRFKSIDGATNNGDLCATLSLMKDHGWNSNESIKYGIDELLYYGFIVRSRYGDRKRCHLYAITCWAVDECNNKLDISSTIKPLNFWMEDKSKWKRPMRKKN